MTEITPASPNVTATAPVPLTVTTPVPLTGTATVFPTPAAVVPMPPPPNPPVAATAHATPAPTFTLAPAVDAPTVSLPAPEIPPDPATIAMELVEDLVASVRRRSFLTGEFWAPIAGAAGSATLAQIGVPGPEAVQVIGMLAPILAGGFVAALRNIHKAKLVTLAEDVARIAHLNL